MDWLDLLAVQETLKSLLQHHSSKPSILQSSAFFTVQLSHPYMTTGKTIGLTRWTFAGKVVCLLFNMLSRLVITFLPRSKCLLISWLQSPSAGQASLSITNSRSLLKLRSIESVMPSSHLILCRPLLLLPPIPPSIRIFSSESTLPIKWPKYWSFSCEKAKSMSLHRIKKSRKQYTVMRFTVIISECLQLLININGIALRKGNLKKQTQNLMTIRMENTCKSMADSCQCMAKTTTIL